MIVREEIDLDLTEFVLEGNINGYYSRMQNPIRITCRWVTDDVMKFERRGYTLAIYVKSINELFRVDANNLQWMLISSGIKQTKIGK